MILLEGALSIYDDTAMEVDFRQRAILTEFIEGVPVLDRLIYQHVGEPCISPSNGWNQSDLLLQ